MIKPNDSGPGVCIDYSDKEVRMIPPEDLLPCPFCGNRDFEDWVIESQPVANDTSVRCKYCGAQGPEMPTIKEAREEWNKRGEKEGH